MRAYYRQLVMHAMHLPFIANVMLRYKEMTEEEHARNTQVTLIKGLKHYNWFLDSVRQNYSSLGRRLVRPPDRAAAVGRVSRISEEIVIVCT